MGMRIALMCMRSASFSAPEATAKAPTPIKSLTPLSAIKALQTLCRTAKKKADQLMSLGLTSSILPGGVPVPVCAVSGGCFNRSVAGELIGAFSGLGIPFQVDGGEGWKSENEGIGAALGRLIGSLLAALVADV